MRLLWQGLLPQSHQRRPHENPHRWKTFPVHLLQRALPAKVDAYRSRQVSRLLFILYTSTGVHAMLPDFATSDAMDQDLIFANHVSGFIMTIARTPVIFALRVSGGWSIWNSTGCCILARSLSDATSAKKHSISSRSSNAISELSIRTN